MNTTSTSLADALRFVLERQRTEFFKPKTLTVGRDEQAPIPLWSPLAPKKPSIPLNVWIPWEGGECPVPNGARGKVRMRALGGRCDEVNSLHRWAWDHLNCSADIVAYMVTELPGEQPSAAEAAKQPAMHPADARMIANDGPAKPKAAQKVAEPVATVKPAPAGLTRSPDLSATSHQVPGHFGSAHL